MLLVLLFHNYTWTWTVATVRMRVAAINASQSFPSLCTHADVEHCSGDHEGGTLLQHQQHQQLPNLHYWSAGPGFPCYSAFLPTKKVCARVCVCVSYLTQACIVPEDRMVWGSPASGSHTPRHTWLVVDYMYCIYLCKRNIFNTMLVGEWIEVSECSDGGKNAEFLGNSYCIHFIYESRVMSMFTWGKLVARVNIFEFLISHFCLFQKD